MKRFLLLAIAFAAAAQDLGFRPLTQPVIEQRLRSSTDNNAKREAIIKGMFEEAGCTGDAVEEQKVAHVAWPNVICTHPGSSGDKIVVGGHFDMVEKGQGVVDNWSGASLLPSLFQAMGPSKHTFVFVAFTGEERGELGSKAFVKTIDRAQVKAMVNLDTLGLDETKVWMSRADPMLVQWLGATAASMKLPLAAVNVEQVGSTDSEVFRLQKIPAITIHSITQDTWHILHSPLDTIKEIKMDAYYRTYNLVLGYLLVLDVKLD
jgi:Iap family predicted aminopeptidase